MAHNLSIEQEALLLHSWAQKIGQSDVPNALRKRHQNAQDKALKACRARCAAEATRYGKELQQLLQERTQDHIRLQAAPANERLQESCKVLGEEILRCRANIEAINKAQSMETAAVFVDLPLEKYPERLGLGSLDSEYGMDDVYTVLIGIAVATLGILAMFYLFLWSKEVRFETIPPDGPTGRAVVRIHNEASAPVDIIAPLESESTGDRSVSSYGFQIYVRDKGKEDFQLISPPNDAWTYQGTPTQNRDAIHIAPNISIDLSLSLKSLEKEHPKLDGYRIVGKSVGGREVYRFEQAFMR